MTKAKDEQRDNLLEAWKLVAPDFSDAVGVAAEIGFIPKNGIFGPLLHTKLARGLFACQIVYKGVSPEEAEAHVRAYYSHQTPIEKPLVRPFVKINQIPQPPYAELAAE